MFAVQSPGVAELADYFGGRVDPTEANFQGFTTPVYETDHQTGEIFTTRPSTSRIVLARSLLSNPDPAILRHEIVHALLFSVNNARDVPTWAVEGAAVYFSDISAGERAFRSAAGRRGLAGAKTMPSDAKFYGGNDDAVARRYGMGYLGIAYLADRYGERSVLRGLMRLYRSEIYENEFTRTNSKAQFAAQVRSWAG